jgi:hypothetical protein
VIGGDGGPQDLGGAFAAALDDDEADDAARLLDHPATMTPQITAHLVGHVVSEEVVQLGHDRRARTGV